MAATKTINTNINDYARPKTKKGDKKDIYPFNKVKEKPIKLSQAQQQSS